MISANVVVNAFPNIWGSGSSAAVEADIPNLGPNVIIVRPIDPTNSEQISKAGENLRNICGSEHVRAHQTSDGTPSWLVTLSDRETLQYLPEHPWLQLDEISKETFSAFSRRRSKRAGIFHAMICSTTLLRRTTTMTRRLKRLVISSTPNSRIPIRRSSSLLIRELVMFLAGVMFN